MLVFTLLLASVLAYKTELSCVNGIVDVSPRPYVGKMSESACASKAKPKRVSFVWGNGGYCHHYKVLLDRTKTTNVGLGSWKTCGYFPVPESNKVNYANAKQAVGPNIMCVVDEFDFYYAHMEDRCASGYEVNRNTGKCVPPYPHNSIEPENCVGSCGNGFCCQTDSGLCLKCGEEAAPATKKCDDIYGCVHQPCQWYNVGETANEEALGLSFDSDEQAESVAVTQATGNTSGFDVTVEAFAALGFAVTLYGAYRHYIK